MGCTVEGWLRRLNGETERRPGCGEARRSRWCKRRGAAVARATARGGQSSLGTNGEREHGGEVVRVVEGEEETAAERALEVAKPAVAATLATGNGGQSSPECGGARERRGESEGESAGLGKQGEMDEGSTGVLFIGSGRRDRGRTWRNRPAKWGADVGWWRG